MSVARLTEQQLEDHLVRMSKRLHQPAPQITAPDPVTRQIGAAKFWDIQPTPAPRQVNRDKYAPSPSVKRYRAFCEECRIRQVWQPLPGDLLVFFIRIPKSRTREGLDGMPHTQKPDVDNLEKSVLDALYGDDSHIWTITAMKLWHPTGGIYIERRDPVISVPFMPVIAT